MSRIDLDKIRIDGGTQMRAAIDQTVVDDYADRLGELPDSDVFFDGSNHWLADGFHRYHAHRKKGEASLACKVHNGTQREAILFAVGANKGHGLQRSVADKQKAVKTLLDDDEWSKKSATWIAETVGVGVHMVSKIKQSTMRAHSGHKSTNGKPETSVKTKDGRTIKTENIGRKSPKVDVFFDDEKTPEETAGKPSSNGKHKSAPVVKDELGEPIDDPKILAMFARRPEIHTLLHSLSQIKSTVLGAIEEKDGLFYRIDHSRFKADIENLRRQIRFTEPYALCAYCRGRNPNCKACKGQGWLSKEAHERFVAEDLKV